jgi:glycosyltransferase involved in cell wall biosynthesis
MTRKIRLLHITQTLFYGGMERLIADMVRRIDHDRFDVHVLCTTLFGKFSEGLDEVAGLHLARPLTRSSLVWPASLRDDIRKIAPDVVHSHSGIWFKASAAARLAGVKRIVHTEHGRAKPDPWSHRLVDAIGARRTDVVVAVSAPLATQLEHDLRIPHRKIVVVTNGVDTDLHRPVTDDGVVRRELGIPADTPILGSIGRLQPIKGYDVMVEAFAILRARWSGGPPPVLVVGGEGSERPALEQRVREHGLGGAVHLLGWRDDIRSLHASFTLFTMSSHSEGTSVSLLEAMSAGICPVVTDVGANSAVLGEPLRHRLVPAAQPGLLADAWLEALRDADRRCRDAATARTRVVTDFGLDAMVRAYEGIYSS